MKPLWRSWTPVLPWSRNTSPTTELTPSSSNISSTKDNIGLINSITISGQSASTHSNYTPKLRMS